MRLLSTPFGWADRGGMYKCKFMGFMYVLVEMELSGSSWTVRSRKFIDLSGGSTSQVRSPNCMRFAM